MNSTKKNGDSLLRNLPNRRLLGIPVCTLEYIPRGVRSPRATFSETETNVVNGGGATVILRGTPLRPTVLPVPTTPRRWLRPTVAMRSLAFIEVRASINVHIVRLGGYDIVPAQAGLSFEPSSVKVEVAGADATAPSIVRKPSSRQKNVTRFSLFRRREKRGKRKTRALLDMRGAEHGGACGPDHGPSPAV